MSVFALIMVFILCLFMLMQALSISVWTISYLIILGLFLHFHLLNGLGIVVALLLLSGFLALSIKPFRRQVLSKPLLAFLRHKIPTMSVTEREAIYAGTVSFEGEILSGNPDFESLLACKPGILTVEERQFIEGPLVCLCRMIDDWDITHHRLDMPQEIWDFLGKEKFFGLIIPKAYGGLGFSAIAQIHIFSTLYSRSITVATTVSVPNSLGPAELLLDYGTEAQKDYYLPRLANGSEIPCFALTSPQAGSDAASITDKGFICKKIINAEEILGISISWNKRYITLCPVATVIGLAFRLYDPENLLGKGMDIGISCALIPASTKGVIKGRRHFPLNTALMNGPTQGQDVFVPLDCLIGGVAMAGCGWRMLMECLSAGRAISLPASACGGTQTALLASGAYARIRNQFHLPIARFEGIEEPLARITANAWIIDAAIHMTADAIDRGAKPAVAGAILKYHSTERSKQVVLDAMDIHGGKGICLGPSNYLARGYEAMPISITVEGANILTRSLIIFGQGIIRCHPWLFMELEAIHANQLNAFDKAVFAHLGFFLTNLTKTFVFSLTKACWTRVPKTSVGVYYRQLHRLSANLAFLSDFALFNLGESLKRREKISARLGDLLSHLYLAAAVLKRYHNEGEKLEERPLIDYACQHLFHLCDTAILGVIENFPNRAARFFLKSLLQPFGIRHKEPLDALGAQLATIATTPSALRDKLTAKVFKEPLANCPLGCMEDAFHKIHAVEKLEQNLTKAFRKRQGTVLSFMEQIEEAKATGLINAEDYQQLMAAEKARADVIAVDSFAELP